MALAYIALVSRAQRWTWPTYMCYTLVNVSFMNYAQLLDGPACRCPGKINSMYFFQALLL